MREFDFRQICSKRVLGLIAVTVLGLGDGFPAGAQQSGADQVEQRIAAVYSMSQLTSDGHDLLSVGAVLVLQKDGLLTCQMGKCGTMLNVYQDGLLTQSGLESKLAKGLIAVGEAGVPVHRKFGAGTKLYLAKVMAKPNLVYLGLMTDRVDGVRYGATLEIPAPRGTILSSDYALAQLAQIVPVAGQSAMPKSPGHSPVFAEPTADQQALIEQALSPVNLPPEITQSIGDASGLIREVLRRTSCYIGVAAVPSYHSALGDLIGPDNAVATYGGGMPVTYEMHYHRAAGCLDVVRTQGWQQPNKLALVFTAVYKAPDSDETGNDVWELRKQPDGSWLLAKRF
jgi:hypothetical protein